jgi:predicted transcriptional regulator
VTSFIRTNLLPLGPLEQQLLKRIWARGNATVRELVDVGDLDIAYTTVMTTLDRLYKKKLLDRAAEGRAFRYSPRVTKEELQRDPTTIGFGFGHIPAAFLSRRGGYRA